MAATAAEATLYARENAIFRSRDVMCFHCGFGAFSSSKDPLFSSNLLFRANDNPALINASKLFPSDALAIEIAWSERERR